MTPQRSHSSREVGFKAPRWPYYVGPPNQLVVTKPSEWVYHTRDPTKERRDQDPPRGPRGHPQRTKGRFPDHPNVAGPSRPSSASTMPRRPASTNRMTDDHQVEEGEIPTARIPAPPPAHSSGTRPVVYSSSTGRPLTHDPYAQDNDDDDDDY